MPDIRKVTTERGRYYEIDQERYPSITTILSVKENKALKEWRERVGEKEAQRISKESTDIGTAMHSFFEHHLKGIELPKPITEEEKQGYRMFQAGKTLISNYVKEVVAQECMVYSHILRVAGQFDLLCRNRKGELVLVDFKSAKKRKYKSGANDYRLQTAFYRQCIKETLGLDIHHSALFFVTRDLEAYWLRFENNETDFKELVDVRLNFVEREGW